MVFFAFVFDSSIHKVFYPKLLVIILSGFLYTHLLRSLIKAFGLRPPALAKKWWQFTVLIMSILVLFNLTNS
ncbi:hypothetical protein, partial [Stenotrophomonas maltophilia]|uniref:hypothetical protein n=1 Tax=Stenotrophomonas maltophilia TaxID=40324 RepID=UPI0019549880